jgi:hypothetical protein
MTTPGPVPADALLAQVREFAEGYEVFGELGGNDATDIWYLARDAAAGALVALRLRAQEAGGDEPAFSLEVARELGADVAMGAGLCPACTGRLRNYARFCSRCGFDLATGSHAPRDAEEQGRLLAEVREAGRPTYEVLGEMPLAGEVGVVYFAIEVASSRLVRLRLRQEQEELSLAETTAMLPLRTQAGTLSVAYASDPGGGSGPASGSIPAAAPPAAGGGAPRIRVAGSAAVGSPSKPTVGSGGTRRPRAVVVVVAVAGVVVLIVAGYFLLRR